MGVGQTWPKPPQLKSKIFFKKKPQLLPAAGATLLFSVLPFRLLLFLCLPIPPESPSLALLLRSPISGHISTRLSALFSGHISALLFAPSLPTFFAVNLASHQSQC
ncbi:hypothetical protein PIB30_006082 [Stylosanthes scabra]|uniref:Uncharacterized protein n=1 Tax=Stylosanthes scabra TaxID=79078 RepID=A0ABU6V4H1_9FABA|nr:hypothetical protein [Stylosanthes scabra]